VGSRQGSGERSGREFFERTELRFENAAVYARGRTREFACESASGMDRRRDEAWCRGLHGGYQPEGVPSNCAARIRGGTEIVAEEWEQSEGIRGLADLAGT